jgi:integrase
MINRGNSKTTISIYLRALRSIFNDGIQDGIISKELYPFGKRRYQIPNGKNTKKALTLQEVGQIFNYQAIPGSPEEMARDYWLFLYLCNGMNVKDMALLKYKNINGDVLSFERAKTSRTKRDAEPIRVMLSEEAILIIKKMGNPSVNNETYIFRILEKGITPEREKDSYCPKGPCDK